MNTATYIIMRAFDFNPISVILRKNSLFGYVLLADENDFLLCDENLNYLAESDVKSR